MYTMTRPNDWWVYKAENGFIHIGRCTEETARKIAGEDYDLLFQAKHLFDMKRQVEKAIEYQKDLEYEHTLKMQQYKED